MTCVGEGRGLIKTITTQENGESDRLKEQACDNCKEKLQNMLSEEGLRQFEKIFYEESKNYIFRRKKL